MSKIICDVCGTTYPETASQCPICGYVRPADTKSVASDAGQTKSKSAGTYTYVKGGRFSKTNVRKRNQTAPAYKPSTAQRAEDKRSDKKQEKKSDKGLVILVILLLLAIIAVTVYIAWRYFLPEGIGPLTHPDGTTQGTGNSEQTEQTPALTIPCTSLTVTPADYELNAVGEGLLLSVKVEPADTTDAVWFESSDPSVVTVSANGNVVAEGPGEASILVTCGDIVQRCYITCNIETEPPTEAPTEPSGEPTEPTTATEPVEELKLNRSDFTLAFVGDQWNVYSGSIDRSKITWWSDNEAVATIKNGVVVAVNAGTTTVYAEYNGVKVSCIVRCSFPKVEGIPGNGGVSEGGPN